MNYGKPLRRRYLKGYMGGYISSRLEVEGITFAIDAKWLREMQSSLLDTQVVKKLKQIHTIKPCASLRQEARLAMLLLRLRKATKSSKMALMLYQSRSGKSYSQLCVHSTKLLTRKSLKLITDHLLRNMDSRHLMTITRDATSLNSWSAMDGKRLKMEALEFSSLDQAVQVNIVGRIIPKWDYFPYSQRIRHFKYLRAIHLRPSLPSWNVEETTKKVRCRF